MGPCVVFFGWFIVVLIFAPIFILGIRIKSWILRIIGGVPLAFIVLIIISVFVRIFLAGNPNYVLKEAFGKLPENNIKVMEHQYRFSTDYISIHLKISLDEKGFETIFNTGFMKTPKDRMEQIMSYSDHPKWFKPLDGLSEFYENPNRQFGLTMTDACLIYNKADKIAYFYGSGID